MRLGARGKKPLTQRVSGGGGMGRDAEGDVPEVVRKVVGRVDTSPTTAGGHEGRQMESSCGKSGRFRGLGERAGWSGGVGGGGRGWDGGYTGVIFPFTSRNFRQPSAG